MAGTVGKGVLLLKDAQGDKSGTILTGFRKKKDVPVLRGSLLIAISPKDAPSGADGKPAHNYTVDHDDITLYCSEYDIAPLTNYEFQLLSGISTLGARYDAFVSDNHEWGSNLRVGDTVYVALPTKEAIANTGCQAVVRWIGTLPGETGITFGIEITEEKYRGSGSTNGVFQYKQHFVCDDNCGMFVSLEKLATTPNFRPTKTPNAQTTKATLPNQVLTRLGLKTNNEGTGDRANTSQGPAAGTRSQGHKNSGSRFKKGDRVITHNKDQIPIHGTVKWTGEANTNSGKVNAVGIETDIPVQKSDFLITLTGLSSNFKCESSKHGKVAVPEELVRTEMEDVEERQRKRDELARLHERAHFDPGEKDMLRDANIESVALNPAEQERMIQKYKQGIDENKQQQGSIRRPDDPANSHLHRGLSQDTRSTGNNPEAPRSKPNHIYDDPSNLSKANLGHHSASASNILSHQKSQPGNIQSGEEAMLMGAKVEASEMDKRKQIKMLEEFNRQRDEKRKMETARDVNPSGSCVDPPNSHHSENHPPPIYGNMPGAAVMAIAPESHDSTKHQFVMGSRVTFSDPPRYGEIRWMGNFPQVNGLVAGVELEEDMEGCTDGTWQEKRCFSCKYGRAFFCPVTALYPDQRGSAPSQFAGNTPPIQREPRQLPPLPRPAAPVDVSKGSTVQFGDSRNPWHGIVRWVGNLPGEQELLAGIELEEYADRCGDGELNGVRYFQCGYGKATFYPVARLQPDQRFADSAPAHGFSAQAGNPLQVAFEEGVDQPVPPPLYYVGDQKGIQGNQNSCYLDSSLFGLFALSDIFDEMFLAVAHSTTADINRQAISDMLWKGIVNPLRKNGVVRFESVMIMRNKLGELGKMEGITEKEKDPEEFLNMLFKHMLRVPAFISIRRPYGVEQEFFVQLFVEPNPNIRLPTVGVLITMMFKEQNISFTKIPSKFLVQVPRFGREFKTYQKIVPDLKLNIAEITDSAKTSSCMFCGELSQYKCSECVNEFERHDVTGYVHYCATCCPLAHKKDERKQHKPEPALNNNNELYKLDLLSVICIETSHYVCFTRDLNTDTWLFFDSMANRVYDTYNIPRITDCTRELNEWVYKGDQDRLINTPPRELPELVRRFTQDIYMCVYIQPDIAMYGNPDDSLH